MEIIVGLVVAAVVLIVTLRKQPKRSGKSHPRRPEGSPHEWRPVTEPETPRAFDAQSSIAQTTKRVLQGTAYVVDGDTITIQKTQVRLFGRDAPELDHPYGKNAKFALIGLCKGQSVRAEIVAVDDHGRTVAKCSLQEGRDLSSEMVKLGLAIDWAKFSGGKYRALETPDARKKLWLADARQNGRMDVWEKFEAKRAAAPKRD